MKHMYWTLALLALGVLSACGKGANTEEPAAETAGMEKEQAASAPEDVLAAPGSGEPTSSPKTASNEAAVENKVPTLAVVITHKVKDFDAWKKGFDEHQAARQEAGIIAHHLNRGVKDPLLVSVYMVATDLDKLKAFLADPALKDAMKAAGVKGKPDIAIVTPVENHTATDPTLPAAMISHEVKDYDAWKLVFDEDATRRTEAGLVGYALHRDQAKPNLVTIYAQGKTSEELDAFIASPELKAKMKSGGVKGKPKTTMLQGVEWKQYTK